MNRSRLPLALLLAIVLGATAMYANERWLRSRTPADAPVVPTQTLFVAAHLLAAGVSLTAADVTPVEWPQAFVPRGAIHEADALKDRVLGRSLAAGELLVESTLLPLGSQAGLSGMIGRDARAVSVKVDAVVGVGGFVRPGSRVDVLATLRDQGTGGGSFSAVVLQDVRVLAIDQTFEEGAGEPKLVSVVTLEVDPDEAQRLVFGAHEGRLQLALRNAVDGGVVETRSVGAGELRGVPLEPVAPEPPPAAPARIAARPRVEVVEGLDVRYAP